MTDKQSLFNNDSELKSMIGWKHRIENPEITHLKQVLGKKVTRYNKWCQSLEYEKTFSSQTIKLFIGKQNQFVHTLQHMTLFTDLSLINAQNIIKQITLKIKTTSNDTQLFSFTFDEYIALINLLNIQKEMFYIPFQYFVFGKQVFHSCYTHFLGFELELTIAPNSSLFSTRIDSMCYTLGEHELKRSVECTHSYFVNKYLPIQCETNESVTQLQLNYTQPIRSIVAYNYSQDNDICVHIDSMPFYGSYDNAPYLYGRISNDNLFDYLSEIDKVAYSSIAGNCDHHMYFKTLDNNLHFMDVDDCYNKILPINKIINVESACGSEIGKISFLIQFVIELQMDESCMYSQCIKPLRHNPISYPLTKVSNTEFVEGYWQKYNECGCCNQLKYPYPVNSGIQVDEVFLQNLEHIKKYCKIDYYFGASFCRLCEVSVGGGEYSFKTEGKLYRFPEGIVHYYIVHNVQPSDEFMEAVEQYVVDNE